MVAADGVHKLSQMDDSTMVMHTASIPMGEWKCPTHKANTPELTPLFKTQMVPIQPFGGIVSVS
jgi:hypothetical protein